MAEKDRIIDDLVARAAFLVGRLDHTVATMQDRLKDDDA